MWAFFTPVRLFVIIILLLVIATFIVPFAWNKANEYYEPKLLVWVDGKAAGRSIIIKAGDEIFPCSKGRCRINNQENGEHDQYLIEKLADKLPNSVIHSSKKRRNYYQAHTNTIQWSIDATKELKKFGNRDLTIAVDTTKQSVSKTDAIQAPTETASQQPVTLGLSELNPDLVRLIGVVLVIAVIYFGFKFIAVGGHHH